MLCWSSWAPPQKQQTLVYTQIERLETDDYQNTTSIVRADKRDEFFPASSQPRFPRVAKLVTLPNEGMV